jgi:DNA-binding NtrC family response regulator
MIRASSPAVAVVVAAASRKVESAIDFVREGARDYIEYPLVGDRLERLVSAAAGLGAGRRERERFFSSDCPPDVAMVGHSPGILQALERIGAVARSNCNPVLLLGETGTGKELAARAVHAIRCRANDSFVAVNCATLNANLLESELFGHVRGAFTGADRDKTGLFETAGSGTVFLDEVSEMPPALQAKLLRVLQEKTFRKVGGTEDIACNATIIASSNRDLLAESTDGKFRRDLYYRLAVFPIVLPALASEDRRSDIPLLAEYFLETSSVSDRAAALRLSEPARAKLEAHNWPGNVRELKNVIDRAVIIESADEVAAESIILDCPANAEPTPITKPFQPKDFSLETAEREFIMRALKETNWQRTRAAALLGITRATLHAKLKRYEIRPPGAARTPARASPKAPQEALQNQPA